MRPCDVTDRLQVRCVPRTEALDAPFSPPDLSDEPGLLPGARVHIRTGLAPADLISFQDAPRAQSGGDNANGCRRRL
jgi:hypothetical protein